jgi:hypothetical protein
VFAKELLGAQAAGSARLPVDAQADVTFHRIGTELGWTGPFARP